MLRFAKKVLHDNCQKVTNLKIQKSKKRRLKTLSEENTLGKLAEALKQTIKIYWMFILLELR